MALGIQVFANVPAFSRVFGAFGVFESLALPAQ